MRRLPEAVPYGAESDPRFRRATRYLKPDASQRRMAHLGIQTKEDQCNLALARKMFGLANDKSRHS